jgi:hypothetical protein
MLEVFTCYIYHTPAIHGRTASKMFSLRPLPLQSEDLGILPAMMPIEPRFALPSLDEYVSSPDRLLAGMVDRLGLRREPDTGSLEKGKHKEVVEEVAGEKEVDRAVDDSDFWLRAGDLEPGPSRPRRTKVGPTFY